MSNAVAGVGALLKRGDGTSSETFTTIAEIRNWEGPDQTREMIDVTNLDSTGEYREFITGFIDPGEIRATVNFTLDAYDDLLADFQGGSSGNWQIVLPDSGATTFDFAALVQGLPMSVSPGDAITFDLSLKITGAITLTS